MINPPRRMLSDEWMDRDDVPVDELRRSLHFLRQVNRYLCGTRTVVHQLLRFSRHWPRGRRIDILDLATGSADIPLAIVRCFARTGHAVHVTALDRHPVTLALAAEHVRGDPRITFVRADALNPPFEADRFDYTIASLFLHHLDDGQVIRALGVMDRLARRGLIWNDLLRKRRADWWCRLLTLRRHHIVKHDARASVAAGFRRREVLAIRDRLNLTFLRFRHQFGHRFTLAGERAVPQS